MGCMQLPAISIYADYSRRPKKQVIQGIIGQIKKKVK